MINCDLTDAYLGSNFIFIPEQLTGTASLNKELARESLSLIASTYYINKAILCQRNNDADNISEEFLEHP
jgi:hypothetical protein